MSRYDGRCERVCREVGGNIEGDAIECALSRLLSRKDLFVCSLRRVEVEGCYSLKWFFVW